MAGLYLGASGAVRTGSPTYSSTPMPASVTEAAFGSGSTMAAPSGLGGLHPRNAQGMAFWGGVIAIGLLVLIRRSLPN